MSHSKSKPQSLPDKIKEMFKGTFPFPIAAGIFVGVLVLGTVLGFGVAQLTGGASAAVAEADSPDATVEEGKTEDGKAAKSAGIKDKELFPDEAKGKLKKGGLDGEGSYHLERPGGESQYVYLTSTTIDLAPYVGKKVKVNGKTFAGQKVGWLMDVGYIEITN